MDDLASPSRRTRQGGHGQASLLRAARGEPAGRGALSSLGRPTDPTPSTRRSGGQEGSTGRSVWGSQTKASARLDTEGGYEGPQAGRSRRRGPPREEDARVRRGDLRALARGGRSLGHLTVLCRPRQGWGRRGGGREAPAESLVALAVKKEDSMRRSSVCSPASKGGALPPSQGSPGPAWGP